MDLRPELAISSEPAPSSVPPAAPRRLRVALAGVVLLAGGGGASAAAAQGPSGPSGPPSAPTDSPSVALPSDQPPPARPHRSRSTPTGTPRGPAHQPAGCPGGSPPPAGRQNVAPATTGGCPVGSSTATNPTGAPPGATPLPASVPALSPLASAAAALIPNFFIDNYRIPLFLLPVYQAAGTQYGVPWQVLAAINEIETDYGRNLSISSAGAEGWMQFLPQSWRAYGVDANLDGHRDPYDPVDAIFGAARYLHAAGASRDLHGAILAYNHAEWYVQSVLARARLIQGTPDDLTGALSGLAQGRFPVAGTTRYSAPVGPAGAASPSKTFTAIASHPGSPVVAAQDGVITAMGSDGARGTYVMLEDGAGDHFVYQNLGHLAGSYPVLRDARAHSAAVAPAGLPSDTPPRAPATAGAHALVAAPRSTVAAGNAAVAPPRERLYANPLRPGALATGGRAQIAAARSGGAGRRLADTANLGIPLDELTQRPLRPGAHVLAGTVLGQSGQTALRFAVRPAGNHSPRIDPRPLLDGWRLLDSTSVYGAGRVGRSIGERLGLGQILLAGQPELERRVLADSRVHLSACGRAAVAGGSVDRRVLGTLELLATSGLAPTVRSLPCPPSAPRSARVLAAHPTIDTVDLTAINNTPIAGHQGAGSVTDVAIRRLLTLQGALKPKQIVSLMSYPRTDNTLSLPTYARRVRIAYRPQALVGSPALAAAMSPAQWKRLAARLARLTEPALLGGPAAGH